MALETLKGLERIGDFRIMCNEDRPTYSQGNVNWVAADSMRTGYPICIDYEKNMISFKIQDGPIKENGKNGCQVNTVIETAKVILEGLDRKFPSAENQLAIGSLECSLEYLAARTKDRETRGVEGLNEV